MQAARFCGSTGEAMEVLASDLLGVPVLKVTGDLDHLTAPALEKAVGDALSADGMRLLVDLADCPYLDSGGLSVLLFTLREVREKGWIGVIAPNANLLRLFEITGLAAAPDFRVFSSCQEAMVALEG